MQGVDSYCDGGSGVVFSLISNTEGHSRSGVGQLVLHLFFLSESEQRPKCQFTHLNGD